ncbi:hypothetical protein P4H82_27725 [Bacillus cereus]|nr:hypothetical protein [Bacillus cereus]MEB9190691.1 hypothetical protein [Bacillus cereus]
MKKKTSIPLDFKKIDTETLIMYSNFYMDKVDEGAPMEDYYKNMVTLVNLEIERRKEKSLKNIKKLID